MIALGINRVSFPGAQIVNRGGRDLICPPLVHNRFRYLNDRDQPGFRRLAGGDTCDTNPLQLMRESGKLGHRETRRVDPADAAIREAGQHGAVFPMAQAGRDDRTEPLARQIECRPVEP